MKDASMTFLSSMFQAQGRVTKCAIIDKGDELISLNGNGSYSLAKHRNSLVRTFSRSARMGNASGRDVPGPGS